MRGATRLRDALQVPRIWKYRALSTCRRVTGKGIVHQPVLLLGSGAIAIGRDVRFGWPTSPEFHTGYLHLEAAAPEAVIEIGDEAEINNNAYIKSEGAGIYIGPRALLGSTCRSSTRTSTTFTRIAAGAAGRRWPPSISRERLHRRRDQDPQGRDHRPGSVVGAGSVVHARSRPA